MQDPCQVNDPEEWSLFLVISTVIGHMCLSHTGKPPTVPPNQTQTSNTSENAP